MVYNTRLLTILLLAALTLSACQPITPRPMLWPQVAAPDNLELVGHIGGAALTIEIQDHYAYIGFNAEFAIFDLTDTPVAGYFDTPGFANAVAVSRDLLYVADQVSGLWILRFQPFRSAYPHD